MKPVSRQTDSQLEYNINDCNNAIVANPENPKARQYMDERDACYNEQIKRRHKRTERSILKRTLPDPLAFPRSIRHRLCGRSTIDRKNNRFAMWQLAHASGRLAQPSQAV